MRLKGGVYNCIIRLQVRKSNFSWNNPLKLHLKYTSKQLGTQKRKSQLNQIKSFAYYYEHYWISCFYVSKSFIEQFSSTVLHARQAGIKRQTEINLSAIFFIHTLNCPKLKSVSAVPKVTLQILHKCSPSLHLGDLLSPVKSLKLMPERKMLNLKIYIYKNVWFACIVVGIKADLLCVTKCQFLTSSFFIANIFCIV